MLNFQWFKPQHQQAASVGPLSKSLCLFQGFCIMADLKSYSSFLASWEVWRNLFCYNVYLANRGFFQQLNFLFLQVALPTITQPITWPWQHEQMYAIVCNNIARAITFNRLQASHDVVYHKVYWPISMKQNIHTKRWNFIGDRYDPIKH